ncbi:MAG: ornithine carbamoyltransferase [Phycisphaerales bacterium]|nr:ornithine carbamoyltransferase [Phycisphaerales bacterium]
MSAPTHPLLARDLLTVTDLSSTEILGLFGLASRLKADYGSFAGSLAQRSLVLLFEKPSLRTRVTFELGFQKLGGAVCFLDHQGTPIGERETVEDYAGNLSRWADAIAIRCRSHTLLEQFSRAARVPIINALSDLHHPCQALADLFTLVEAGIPLEQLHLAWVGDGNNVCNSLIEAVATLGARMTIVTPEQFRPAESILRRAQARALRSGARIVCTSDCARVDGVHAIYTDVWFSMGEESKAQSKRDALAPYQVDAALMRRAGSQAKFMHCLPARRGEEVTTEVLDSPASIVLDQAENRMHLQNAILLTMLRPDLSALTSDAVALGGAH